MPTCSSRIRPSKRSPSTTRGDVAHRRPRADRLDPKTTAIVIDEAAHYRAPITRIALDDAGRQPVPRARARGSTCSRPAVSFGRLTSGKRREASARVLREPIPVAMAYEAGGRANCSVSARSLPTRLAEAGSRRSHARRSRSEAGWLIARQASTGGGWAGRRGGSLVASARRCSSSRAAARRRSPAPSPRRSPGRAGR